MYVTLTTPFPVMAITLSVCAFALLAYRVWVRTGDSRSTMDGPGLLLTAAVHLLPDERHDWGTAMIGELTQVQSPSARWWFALGCAWAALFPPRRRGLPITLIGLLSVVAAIATGLAMHWVLPAMQVFAVTFVALVGVLATLTVARSHKPGLTTPGIVTSATLLAGVAGCIAIFAYIAAKYPAAVYDPSHVFSVLFAVLLTGYVWLALTPPRSLTTSRFGIRLGTGAALAYGLVLGLGILAIEFLYTADEGDPALILLLMAVPMALILVCSIIAAGSVQSLRAGIETSVWAGLIIGLLIFNIWLLAPLLGLQIEAIIADNFGRGFEPDFDIWFPRWLGGELGAMITVLALVPGWLLFFGLIGGAIGSTKRRA
jgi:hypothetical protein